MMSGYCALTAMFPPGNKVSSANLLEFQESVLHCPEKVHIRVFYDKIEL